MFEEVRRIKMSGKEEIQQRLESVLQPSLYKKNIQIKKKKGLYWEEPKKNFFFSNWASRLRSFYGCYPL